MYTECVAACAEHLSPMPLASWRFAVVHMWLYHLKHTPYAKADEILEAQVCLAVVVKQMCVCPFLQAIYDYFDKINPGLYKHFDDMFPIVSCQANFDEILIPADHVSRSANDTYYVSTEQVLRCHTSAHQAELLRTKSPAFLVTGGA